MKKKEKSPYADISTKKINAPNTKPSQPKCQKIVGGDLRVRGGK